MKSRVSISVKSPFFKFSIFVAVSGIAALAQQFASHLCRMCKRPIILTVFAFSLTLFCNSAAADDTELYTGLNNTPKVLFVLDLSGSMVQNKDGYSTTRLDRMKEALSKLLANIDDVDVGLMSFTGSGRNVRSAVPVIELLHPVANVDDNQDALQAIVRGLNAGGWTPTVSALYEASLYLRGGAPRHGALPVGESTYQSPISKECQSGHIVLLTDGEPSGDNTIGDHLANLQCTTDDDYPSAECGVELAEYLAKINQIPALPNPTKFTTHSIGFNVDYDWLKWIAAAGGGVYSDAQSSQDLLDAFDKILDSVEIASAASAPTVSINAFNESRHRDELYYSFFQPYRKLRWDGNVKKYRLLNGQVVDKVGVPVLDADGMVSPTSTSFWASAPDGEHVLDGGMAAKQPAGRRWYTDAGGTTPFLVTDHDDLTLNQMDADSDQEKQNLVDWVRGFDGANPPQANRFVADSLHSSPLLVTYRARESDDVLEEAVFNANNMGVLHAVNADTGEELWSYSPEELLPKIKKYYKNESAEHIYGLDGAMTLHTKTKATTAYDHELEKAWLYMTQRRGGNDIFALDVTNAMTSMNPPFEVLWKINGGIADTEFRDLGQTWATPQIIPVQYGCPDACKVKEVLMFGGGYNPVYDNKDATFPVPLEPTGHGNAIYMVEPETGELLWSAGNGAHHDLDLPKMRDSIPTTPVPVDTNADGVVDILFVSDIAGHVWRIDLKRDATSEKDLAIGGGITADLNQPGEALRFFNRVDVVISGTTQGTAFFNLVLGSGMRSSPLHDEPGDNRLFVVKDPWVFSYPPGEDIDAATGKRLPRYTYVKNSDNTRSVIGPTHLWQHGTTDLTGNRQFGYYKNFGATGEKILQPTLTHSGRVFAVSYVPPDANARYDLCNYNLGESRLHILDLADGSNMLPPKYGPYKKVGDGIISIGSIVDTGDGTGADFLTGLDSEKLVDLLAPSNPDVFRRIIRTGWVEKDEY